MFEKVKGVIEENINCGGVKLTPETELLTDLNVNSLDLVELICALEAAFGIEVPEKDIGRFTKVKGIVDYLESNA
jgi:acyl carrier protein